MSALRVHLDGDCWWPCHYCSVEDAMAEAERDADDDEDAPCNGPTCLRAHGLKCNAPADCREFHCPRLTADVKEKG